MCISLKNFQVHSLCACLWIYCCLVYFASAKINFFLSLITVGKFLLPELSVACHAGIFLGGSNRSASYVFAFILFLAAAFFLVAAK